MTEIPYRIRRSSRARRVQVRVDAGEGVEVVLPARAPRRDAEAAMRELRPWVERRMRTLASARWELARPPGTVAYLDGLLELVPEPGRLRVARRGDRLLVPAGDHRRALERWYRRRARAEIAPRLDTACAALGLEHGGLTIRGQRTRWASCSATGGMSFNWRLLLAPAAVLESVVWHEVCHLRVADHSPRFWALLDQSCPGHREQRRWLRRYGELLVL